MDEIESKNSLIPSESEDELNPYDILKFLKRNFKIISIFTFTSLIVSAIYSLKIKPTWEGEMQIVLESSDKGKGGISSKLGNLGEFLPEFGSTTNDTKTEVEILKSPFVMKPVFKFFKQSNEKEIKLNDKLTYKKWLKRYLEIELIKDTTVLTIKYKDKNKERIIPILNLISKEYKKYSGRERNLGISNSINYVKLQVEEKKAQTKKSLYNLQEFSSKNSIGGFDGMIPIMNTPLNQEGGNLVNGTNSISASKRYRNQFAILERLETSLVEKSALYKKNSDVIKILEKKISYLKKSLERPKEILFKYRELARQAMLDENALINLERQLTVLNIEKLKDSQPWELISDPTLNETQIAPKKKSIVRFWGLVGLFLGTLFAYFLERKKGTIYSKDRFKRLFPFVLMKSLTLQKSNFSEDELLLVSKSCLKDKNCKYNFLTIGKENNTSQLFEEQLLKTTTYKNISVKNSLFDIDQNDANYLLIEEATLTKMEILDFLENINLANLKILGWFYISRRDSND